MSRRRWVSVTWPIEMRELGKRMQDRLFSESTASGFVIERIRNTYVEGQFIEQVNFHERVVDPIGRELHSDRVEFYQTQFIASTSGPGLEIIDSSKGTRFFVNQISSICDDAVALSGLTVDPLVWGQETQKILDTNLVTDSLQISDLTVVDGVKAKIILSGNSDVRNAAEIIANGKNYRVEKIKLSTECKPKNSIVLSINGAATTFGKNDESFVLPVREALSSIFRF